MSDSQSELRRLFHREGSATRAPARRRTNSILFPLAILLGFAAVFLALFRDRLIPAPQVGVTPALAILAESGSPRAGEGNPGSPASSGRLLFQASGWIEPDPYPITVTALTDGVVEKIHVLEGDLVREGDLLATLIDIDTRLALDTAEAELKMKKAALDAQRTEAEKAARIAARADLEERADRLTRIERMPGGAVPDSDRVSARLDHSRGQAMLAIREARINEITNELSRIAHDTTALEAGVKAAEAAVGKARLDHNRTRIHAPADGRVLRLLAAPGRKKMIGMEGEDSATIAILYDPARLQVRVDVPLADAAGLAVGQRARIRSSLLPDKVFDGEVTRITGEADIQRNTLQAKVRILAPDDRLRPEMLSRVEFLDSMPGGGSNPAAAAAPTNTTPTANSDTAGALAVFVPESSLNGDAVWICDPDNGRVSRRAVVPTSESRDGRRRLASGVNPGEWVVVSPQGLRDGRRIQPILQP